MEGRINPARSSDASNRRAVEAVKRPRAIDGSPCGFRSVESKFASTGEILPELYGKSPMWKAR
jgi:hypothetical protein